jgi:hypothetical protein
MKRIILIAMMSGAVIAAQAQAPSPLTTDAGSTVRIPAPQYTIELPTKPYWLAPGEFDTYRGVYSLSNGQEMSLKKRGNRMYASLGDRAEQELVAAAHNVFVAKDRNLKMTLFTDQSSDQITGEVLIRMTPVIADANKGEPGQVRRLIAGQ